MTDIKGRPTRQTRAKHGGEKLSIESRLLAATERLLDQGHQFRTLSVEQLANEAGLARATFYLHFRDKAELVTRIMGQFTEELVQANGEWLSDLQNFNPESMGKALAGTVRTFKKHQAIVAAISDTAHGDEQVAMLYQQMIDKICQQSRRSFAALRKEGKALPGATDDVSDVLTWMVVLYATRFIQNRNGAELKRLEKSFVHICASAIFAGNAG